MRIFTGILFCLLLIGPAVLCASEFERQSLFKIERSKNANIIQYDAQVGSDGKLDKKTPVVAYWIRLAEQGQVKKLSWIQRKFVYGFRTDLNQSSDIAILRMAADVGQPIEVRYHDGKYRAVIHIDGTESELKRVYIKARRSGFKANLEYIDVFGIDLKTGQETRMRIVP